MMIPTMIQIVLAIVIQIMIPIVCQYGLTAQTTGLYCRPTPNRRGPLMPEYQFDVTVQVAVDDHRRGRSNGQGDGREGG
jgi:hypothetical protein